MSKEEFIELGGILDGVMFINLVLFEVQQYQSDDLHKEKNGVDAGIKDVDPNELFVRERIM